MFEFIRDFSMYEWCCFVGFPILFFLGVELWLRHRAKKVGYKWKRAEQPMIKSWENNEFTEIDKTIKKHIREQLFGKSIIWGMIVLNVLIQPFSLKITSGLAPFAFWLPSFVLFILVSDKRESNILENGLHIGDIIHHEQLKKNIREVAKYRPYITYPYAFFYHYEKLLLIPEQMNRLIRSDLKSHIAIAESRVLGEEESYLLEETYIAVTGRLRNYDATIEKEGVKAMQVMIKHATDDSIPIEIRQKAMELAKKLQYKSGYELLEEAKKLEAMVSMNRGA